MMSITSAVEQNRVEQKTRFSRRLHALLDLAGYPSGHGRGKKLMQSLEDNRVLNVSYRSVLKWLHGRSIPRHAQLLPLTEHLLGEIHAREADTQNNQQDDRSRSWVRVTVDWLIGDEENNLDLVELWTSNEVTKSLEIKILDAIENEARRCHMNLERMSKTKKERIYNCLARHCVMHHLDSPEPDLIEDLLNLANPSKRPT